HEHGIATVEQVSTVRRWSMACPAMPTCGLAVTEAERALPTIMDQLEVELAKLGLEDERFTVRMTGCPNGCARPYNADIGLDPPGRRRHPRPRHLPHLPRREARGRPPQHDLQGLRPLRPGRRRARPRLRPLQG